MIRHIFTASGRKFWQDDTGYWGVSNMFDSPPSHCGYGSPDTLAKLKNIHLPSLEWAKPERKRTQHDT